MQRKPLKVRMKILHSSDNHNDFFATRLGRTKIVNGINEYYTDRIGRTADIIQMGLSKKVDAFVFAGDFYNRTRPTPQEYLDTFKLFDKVPPEVAIFIIHGNHDEPTSKGCALDPLVGRRKNIFVFTSLSPVEWKGFTVIGVPWGSDIKDVRSMVKFSERPSIIIMHAAVSYEDLRWAETEPTVQASDLIALTKMGCEGIMVGHYHSQVEFNKKVWYSGSPECFTFGEEDQVKGILFWDFENNKLVGVTPDQTDYPRFRTFKAQAFLKDSVKSFPGYVRVVGEVTDKERGRVLSKLSKFKCWDYLMAVTLIKDDRVRDPSLRGTTNDELLLHYLKLKKVKETSRLLDIDKGIEIA